MSSIELPGLLDAEQRQAVDSSARTLRVLAGAGSGKTRVLTYRVARRITDQSVDPQHTLVLTFTRKAADELRTRLKKLASLEQADVITGTFHAIAYAQLRRRWLDQGRTVPAVVSQPTRVVTRVLENLRLNRIANPRSIASELSWAKSFQFKPQTYIDGLRSTGHQPPVAASQMERIFEAYEADKKKRRIVDYDDLLLLMTEALRSDRSFLATQQWQFRHFFVDEFQDLNAAQFSLLQAWLGNRDDLFVVGDANQAIYGWNGADSTYLNDLQNFYPNVETIELRSNYRSTQSVLAVAHSLISDDVKVPEASAIGERPVVREFADDEAEADGVARAVREAHHRNHRWADIAILVRTNAQRTLIEKSLQKFSVPYRSSGGAAWLWEEEVRPALEYLRLMPTAQLAQRSTDVDQLIEEASEESFGYLKELKASIQAALLADPTITVADFLLFVEVGSKQDSPVGGGYETGAVTVTTFHRAKGLEWPVVFIAGMEEGYVPMGSANNDEERRLFYVAVTRAREELHCSWAQKRTVGSSLQTRKPSPWLQNVAQSSRHLHQVKATDVHMAVEVGREVLHIEPEISPAHDALVAWRARQSKLTGIEPKLILDDHTLATIVHLHPTTRNELAAIEGLGPVRAANIGDQLLAVMPPSSRAAEPNRDPGDEDE